MSIVFWRLSEISIRISLSLSLSMKYWLTRSFFCAFKSSSSSFSNSTSDKSFSILSRYSRISVIVEPYFNFSLFIALILSTTFSNLSSSNSTSPARLSTEYEISSTSYKTDSILSYSSLYDSDKSESCSRFLLALPSAVKIENSPSFNNCEVSSSFSFIFPALNNILYSSSSSSSSFSSNSKLSISLNWNSKISFFSAIFAFSSSIFFIFAFNFFISLTFSRIFLESSLPSSSRNLSRRCRWYSSFNKNWCSCCPTKSIIFTISSFNLDKVNLAPFTVIFDFAFLSKYLVIISSSSSISNPSSFNLFFWLSFNSKTPSAKRLSSPFLIISAWLLSPINSEIPSKIIDFPAPVSPVNAINFSLNSKSRFFIIARLFNLNSLSISFLSLFYFF